MMIRYKNTGMVRLIMLLICGVALVGMISMFESLYQNKASVLVVEEKVESKERVLNFKEGESNISGIFDEGKDSLNRDNLNLKGHVLKVQLEERDFCSFGALTQSMEERRKKLEKEGILFNTLRPYHEIVKDPAVVMLRNAIIDVNALKEGININIPEEYKADKNTTHYIVVFRDVLGEEQKSILTKMGAHIDHFIPNRAFAVTIDPSKIEDLKNVDGVIHVEPYHPFFKMSPEVQLYLTGIGSKEMVNVDKAKAGRYKVMLFDSSKDSIEKLIELGIEINSVDTVENIVFGKVSCSPDKLPVLVKSEVVYWVEPVIPLQVMNDLANKTLRAAAMRLQYPGLDGSNIIVAVADTGVDTTHRAFAVDPSQPTGYAPGAITNSRIIYYEVRTAPGSDADGIIGDHIGHGTHVSASILGNGGWSSTVIKSPGSGAGPYPEGFFCGTAPGARLIMFEDFNSFDAILMSKIAWGKGARLMSHSWGGYVPFYNSDCAQWDAIVRDAHPDIPGYQEMVVFFAAGNFGNGTSGGVGGIPNTIIFPGSAKNVITVGAVEQRRLANNLPAYNSIENTDTDWEIADFSSRGPTYDGRIKPDIVAPGHYVMSAQSKDVDFDSVEWPTGPDRDFNHGNLNSGPKYAVMSGTSMATPLAAGCGVLFYQWYTNVYGKAPSPALVKAALVCGARSVHSIVYEKFPGNPIEYEGWGMIDLARTIEGPDSRPIDYIEFFEDSIDGTGQSVWKTIYIDNDKAEGGLKVVLVWSDYPGVPNAQRALVNDLDLVVYAPNRKVYMGNWLGRQVWGTASYELNYYTNILADTVNNVEVVLIRDLLPGIYRIEIKGVQVPQPSQKFALAIAKGISTHGDCGGVDASLALDANNFPVIAYACSQTGDASDLGLVGVRRWIGSAGEAIEFGRWLILRDKWFDFGKNITSEIINGQVGTSQVREVSIAVNRNNGYIYVAWRWFSHRAGDPSSIHFKYYDGTSWKELAESDHNLGICDPGITKDASSPVVGVAWDGLPVVAYIQKRVDLNAGKVYKEVIVKKWDGSQWVKLVAKGKNVCVEGTYVASLDMTMTSAGFPVVVWRDLMDSKIRCYRWTGVSWEKVGSDLGVLPSSNGNPKIAIENNTIYVTWVEIPTGAQIKRTVRVARIPLSGGIWSGLGGSFDYPGISGTNDIPFNPQIDVYNNEVYVSWQSYSNDNNAVYLKKWNGTQWVGIGNSDTNSIVGLGGISILCDMVVSRVGIGFPVITVNNNKTGLWETRVVGLAGDINPPVFQGISSAVGGTNNDVLCTWVRVNDPTQPIDYYVYKTPGNGWSASDPNIPPPTDPAVISDVFNSSPVGIVRDASSFCVTDLPADRLWYFGVRARNQSGVMDSNTKLILAGPFNLYGDADRDWLTAIEELGVGTDPVISDTDGDGMWDGWEWFYSFRNYGQYGGIPPHTNQWIFMDPLDNGLDNIATTNINDGNPMCLPNADPDKDGLMNIEEFNFWKRHLWVPDFNTIDRANPRNWWLDPTNPDSDGDGMPDGWEYFSGLNPADPQDGTSDLDGDGLSNRDEYIWGSDPTNPDTDNDGISDGDEILIGTLPTSPDSDNDGVSDGTELVLSGNPLDQDSNNNDISDGDEYQLGYTDLSSSRNLFVYLLKEDCETASYLNWLLDPDVSLWHRTRTDPYPSTGVVEELYARTVGHAFRCANDVNDGTNLNATYELQGEPVWAELVSPVINPAAAGVINLYASWVEYYETEAQRDMCEVSVSVDGGITWPIVRPGVSGISSNWVYRIVDLTEYVSYSNLQIRFLFKTEDAINNRFRGWWIDDIKVFGGGRIVGVVRDNNGAPIKGATVMAIGRGGVTNVINGHKYVLPGKIFGIGLTDAGGNYIIHGLPFGKYYVKAVATGFKSEFYNGPLYTNTYFYLAFGQVVNRGVYNIDEVGPQGIIELTPLTPDGLARFELEPGGNGGRISVIMHGNPIPVYLNRLDVPECIWNGSTLSPDWIVYTTTNGIIGINNPDWETNAVSPAFIDHVGPGLHEVFLHPGWANALDIPRIVIPVRDGEKTIVYPVVTGSKGILAVKGYVPGYKIYINGRDTGLVTRGPDVMVTNAFLEGEYIVTLVSPSSRKWIAPKIVKVKHNSRTIVEFSYKDTEGPLGWAEIRTVDIHGDPVKGATVYINGMKAQELVDIQQDDEAGTPVLITNIVEGTHIFSVFKDGYRVCGYQTLGVYSGVTTKLIFTLHEADRDYDQVGDQLEIAGYTNIFLYSRYDDPDNDKVNNLTEFQAWQFFGLKVNLFNPDSDGDMLYDGMELGYDFKTNSFGLSILAEKASLNDAYIVVNFSGRFLEGISGLPIPSDMVTIYTNGARLSIEGDSVVVTNVSWRDGPFHRPQFVYYIRRTGEDYEKLDRSHIEGSLVFSDTFPDNPDSDGDIMWDGFEYMFSYRTVGVIWKNPFSSVPSTLRFENVGLDPLQYGKQKEDPDFDGLDNLQEFLGKDNIANTNDFTRPDHPDTDGDSMPDGWERKYNLDPRNPFDRYLDPDNDSLLNFEEWLYGTDPTDPDTDKDLIIDGLEVHKYKTNPLMVDTDLDGLIDGQEVIDTDADPSNGLDGGFFPNWNYGDIDHDGFMDGPTDWDSDGDGMPDSFEVLDVWGNIRPEGKRLDPSNPYDAHLDPDGDGLSNLEEYLVREGRVGISPNDFSNVPYIYGETNGVVVLEAENGTIIYPEWKIENTVSGYYGTGYLGFYGEEENTNTPPLYPPVKGVEYNIQINNAGWYVVLLRHDHPSINPNIQNKVWISFDTNQWVLAVCINAGAPGTWTTDTQIRNINGIVIQNRFYLSIGLHTFSLAGASTNFLIDRIIIYRETQPAPPANIPSSPVVGTIGFPYIWDYPTDPFNPDSDGDGMPDGWEVWYGLHPMDPIPDPETSLGFLIRYPVLWRYYDIDRDGVDNINEYSYRFVLNPNANTNAIYGSLHPWISDTDADGLLDGDEIKEYRANPLTQDTDGDGLADGQGVLNMLGEIKTTTTRNLPDTRRPLNDVWILLPQKGALFIWQQILGDTDVRYADAFDEAWLGYVAIEADQLPFLNPNTFPRQRIIPVNWGVVDYLPDNYGQVGTNVLIFESSAQAAPRPMNELLVYKINIRQEGLYQLFVRSWYYPVNVPPPINNMYIDCSLWIKIDTGPWRKVTVDDYPGDGMYEDEWHYFTKVVLMERQVTGGVLLDCLVYLTPGIHTILISGRSYGLAIDRIVLAQSSAPSPEDVYLPSSSVSGIVPLTPTRRWGGASTVVKYEVRDVSWDGTEGKRNAYVGGIMYNDAVGNQVLLSNNRFVIFGGRDDAIVYNQIWELQNLDVWDFTYAYMLTYRPVMLFHPLATEGEMGLVAAARHFVFRDNIIVNPPNPGRPRPGSPPTYRYFDGDPKTAPLPLFGQEGMINAAQISYITGWDRYRRYYQNVPHDQYWYYTRTHSLLLPSLYVPTEDKHDIIYLWPAASDAYQLSPTGAVYDEAPPPPWLPGYRTDTIFAGGSVYGSYYTGICIGKLYNTRNDFQLLQFVNTNYLSLIAVLAFTLKEDVPTNFTLFIRAELYNDVYGNINAPPVGSVENPNKHAMLTSPTNYSIYPPSIRLRNVSYLPPSYWWTWNSSTNRFIVRRARAGDTIYVNVTPAVREALVAQYRSGNTISRFELGNYLGFVIFSPPSNTNRIAIQENSARLMIITDSPRWKYYYEALIGERMIYWPAGAITPFRRKSSAMAFDTKNNVFVLYGGIDGNRVLGDTWISQNGLDWVQVADYDSAVPLIGGNGPPPRWGHGMCMGANGIYVFGGFDKNNKPLNDLWLWDGQVWREITVFGTDDDRGVVDGVVYLKEKPCPRGGMAFATCRGRPIVFGGTDGDRYFNDTWVLQEAGVESLTLSTNWQEEVENEEGTNIPPPQVPVSPVYRWILVEPDGEAGSGWITWARYTMTGRRSPPARAFMYSGGDYIGGGMIIFGGKAGTLPTSTDTDRDWIDDGVEMDLGGPAAGRAPYSNGLVIDSKIINTNYPGGEVIPYNYKRLGGIIPVLPWYPQRGTYIADFESLFHPHAIEPTPEWGHVVSALIPYEGRRTPPPTIFPATSGYEAMSSWQIDLWWHKFAGPGGVPTDPRDEWELGVPVGREGENFAPLYAYSGRYCFGTDLDGLYENDSIIELYSPLLDLSIPQAYPEVSSPNLNTNDWYLVFHEWLDLADENDFVRVEAVRPGNNNANIRDRRPDPTKPIITVLADRNNAYNTKGMWRRVVVPLSLREKNVYLRFALYTDYKQRAGGWYIDDVAICQGGQISGIYTGTGKVYLYGDAGTNVLRSILPEAGKFAFRFLPAGNYRLRGENGAVNYGRILGPSWTQWVPNLRVDEIVINIVIHSPARIVWNSIPGEWYEVQYTDPEKILTSEPWQTLAVIKATDTVTSYIDYDSEKHRSRFYRVVKLF